MTSRRFVPRAIMIPISWVRSRTAIKVVLAMAVATIRMTIKFIKSSNPRAVCINSRVEALSSCQVTAW